MKILFSFQYDFVLWAAGISQFQFHALTLFSSSAFADILHPFSLLHHEFVLLISTLSLRKFSDADAAKLKVTGQKTENQVYYQLELHTRAKGVELVSRSLPRSYE
ncbi:hypothetical protein SLA2020_197220 [Shorea laevis]